MSSLLHELEIGKPPSEFGLLVAPQQNPDYHFGGVSGIKGSVLVEDGQWDAFMPVPELQAGTYFDTYACVTFSALNCIEGIFSKKFRLPVEFSDRFTAKKSGTTRRGNFLAAVANSIRHDGVVDEKEWPFARGREEKVTWEEYYKDIPEVLTLEGKLFTDRYDVQYEWVEPTPNRMMSALTEAPLQVTVTFSSVEGPDGIVPRIETPENHAVTIYGYEYQRYWKMLDHYTKSTKKVAWDYKFYSALKYDVSERVSAPPSSMKLQNNYLYQLVEGVGGFGLAIGDKFYVDETDKILASWLIRNNGDVKGKVGTLRLEDWSKLEKYNLKGERL